MKEALAADLAEMIVQDYGVSPSEALDMLYGSDTYAKLSEPATGLYFQGGRYVYSYLKHELATGVIG